MPAKAHRGSEIHASAQLGKGVRVEPGAVIGENCIIGAGSVIGRNSIIWSGTVLGENNRIFPFCSLGGEPQDKKYAGEVAPLIIGDNNTIREYCFINKGTLASGETRIGSDNWIMAYVHVAHDCVIGDQTTIANMVQLAGHIHIGDRVVLGGGGLFHQFVRIGAGAMVSGGEVVVQDVPPYALVGRGTVSINTEGMRRSGADAEVIAAIRRAYKLLYRSNLNLKMAVEAIVALPQAAQPSLRELIDFLRLSDLKLLRPKTINSGE